MNLIIAIVYTQDILLLTILAGAAASAYFSYSFWERRIDPRRSMKHFFLYLLANLASIFALAFLAGFLIIHFKDFLIKR